MSHGESCLVRKLGYHVDLTDVDRRLLAALEETEELYAAGSLIRGHSMPNDDLFVVKQGWLMSSITLPNGLRQVLQIYVPGDIVGFQDIPFDSASAELEAVADSTVCPFPKSGLRPILAESPQLTSILLTYGMVDYVVLLDRMRMMGRMSARDRVAHLLLAIHARLKITNEDLGTSFSCPLSQKQVGDAVGLTSVSVSRAKAELQAQQLLSWPRGFVDLKKFDELVEMTGFQDRFHRIDVSWF
jgi:CRP-like cAMP-binding protein